MTIRDEIKIGDRVNKLTLIGVPYYTRKKLWRALFRCECGIEKDIILRNVVRHHTLSCGCWNKEMPRRGPVKHGLTGSQTWQSYSGMLSRCTNKKQGSYKRYGARGIRVCERWLTGGFEAFLEDMGLRPDDMTLDRKDNDGNYTPGNCRWATSEEQLSNRSCSNLITWNGETKTSAQWSRQTGLDRGCIEMRQKLGWSIERMLTTPSVRGRNQYS